MFKHTILNLVLFVILLSLATSIYYSEQPDNQLPLLTDADINSIQSIIIDHNANRTRIIRQQPEHWQITSPVAVAANSFRISSVLQLLQAPVHNQYRQQDVDLQQTGLLQPATSIRFDDYHINFGLVNPVTGLRFVSLGETVYTIEDVYFPLLTSFFGTLVAFDLLPPGSSIEKLILPGQTISKDDKGRWHSNIDSSADDMVNIIQRWQSQQAFGVREYIPREALAEVFIYLQGQQQPISYIVTDSDPWLVLARPELGLEYHLDSENYDRLINPAAGSKTAGPAQ